jgi:nucleoside-diphosphate-sugar epimerase
MIILITGIHGFVGSNLVGVLKAQHIIYGLDLVSLQKEGLVKTYEWNDLEQLPTVDAIIHLAGKAHDTKNTTEEKAYFDINVGLSIGEFAGRFEY